MKILVFGNPLVPQDSLPLKIANKIKIPGVTFKELEPSIDELTDEGRDLIILDTVINTDKVRVIENIDAIITEKIYSLHDFDLGHTLKLLKKMELIDSVKIICVPQSISEAEAIKQVKNVIKPI
ncbi:hypothetical protein ACFLQN_04745 [Candidatus Aenigmatarchaeota archaeon]